MQKNLKIQLGAAALGVIATTALVAGTTYAQSNGSGNFLGLGGRFQANVDNANGEVARHARGGFFSEEAQTAIENNDYNAWVEAHGDDVDSSLLTEERFNELVERHNLHESGELPAGQEGKEHKGMMRGGMMNEGIREAIANNDYDAWLAAHTEDCPNGEELTEERFNKMVEIHDLLEDGDTEGAQELMEEEGFRGRGGEKGGRFMKKQAE